MTRLDNNQQQVDQCLQNIDDADNVPIFENLIKQLKIHRNFVRYGKMELQDDERLRNVYKFVFERNGKQATVLYGDSVFNTQNGSKPTLYDILSCVGSDISIYLDSTGYEDFCNNLGYEPTEKHSQRVYNKVCEQAERLLKIFSEDEVYALPR